MQKIANKTKIVNPVYQHFSQHLRLKEKVRNGKKYTFRKTKLQVGDSFNAKCMVPLILACRASEHKLDGNLLQNFQYFCPITSLNWKKTNKGN